MLRVGLINMTFQLQRCDRQTRALILSIAVCYYAKLQTRDDFERFISPLIIPYTTDDDDARKIFTKEIIRYL